MSTSESTDALVALAARPTRLRCPCGAAVTADVGYYFRHIPQPFWAHGAGGDFQRCVVDQVGTPVHHNMHNWLIDQGLIDSLLPWEEYDEAND